MITKHAGCLNSLLSLVNEIKAILIASALLIVIVQLSTVGDQAFPVAAARTWNSLSQHVTSAPSNSVFRCRIKAFPFTYSFP